MGKASRTKGKRGELEVVTELKEIFPAARRKLDQYQQKSGVDLENTNPLYFQIKNTGRPNAAVSVLHEVAKEAWSAGRTAGRGHQGWADSVDSDDVLVRLHQAAGMHQAVQS